MNVVINNLKKSLRLSRDTFEVSNLSMDAEKRYAVAEIFKNELYIAFKIISIDDENVVGEYFDYYACMEDAVMLMSFSVDWNCINYGFCKLIMWAPEMENEFGGYFDHTAKRFYFDWELYKKCYEEINGVPCNRKNPNG